MVRKLATQVAGTVSRLIESGHSKPPTWYSAVLANPPPILPPRQTAARSRPNAKGYDDLPRTKSSAHKLRPKEVVYDADRVRRQFFADFPFEALRPVSLIEPNEIRQASKVVGKEWTQLLQRGRNPTVEDTIDFTINLHDTQGLSLTDAYTRATSEFVALRAHHEMATMAAAAEARHYGATFSLDQWDRTFLKEGGRLHKTADSREDKGDGPVTKGQSTRFRHNKRWTFTINPLATPSGEFTAGKAYLERWSLPPPVHGDRVVVEPQGDLVSAIAAKEVEVEAEAKKSEDEMDDAELMEAILGKA